MQDFSQTIAAWQPFFITLAGICATLAGLLFVAVSLHPDRSHEAGRTHLKNLAHHTFADFVQVLFVGVFFSVPLEKASFYGVSTVLIVIIGLRQLATRAVQTWQSSHDEPFRGHFLKRLGLSILGRAFLLTGASLLLFGPPDHGQDDMTFIFSGTLVLLMAGLRNAWFLLLREMD